MIVNFSLSIFWLIWYGQIFLIHNLNLKEKIMSGILAVFSDNNVVPSLFEGLQRMQFKYGEHDGVSIAALMAGRIQQRHFVKKEQDCSEQDLSLFLQKKPLTACLSLVCIRQKRQSQKYHVHLAATESCALAYHGFIDNLPDIREELLQLGEEVQSLSPSKLILHLIRRYLNREMSVREASLNAIRRLTGEFAIIALFAVQKSLLIAQRGVPMTLSIKENEVYIASNTAARIVQPTMLLEENSLLILRSFQK
jgi:glucosamine--fructose-6-phosphate aminotransferase (isomerizing)